MKVIGLFQNTFQTRDTLFFLGEGCSSETFSDVLRNVPYEKNILYPLLTSIIMLKHTYIYVIILNGVTIRKFIIID